MAEDLGSSVPRRHLGRILRELRLDAGITLDAASDAIACSRQKVWRIETGLGTTRAVDVRALCDLYNTDPDLTAALVTVAAETKATGWWHAHDNPVPAWFTPYPGLENAAARIRSYQQALLPGLLRTPAYHQAVHPHRPDHPEHLHEVRHPPGNLLTRRLPPPPRLYVVLSEAVLLRRVGEPGVMAEQLTHLLRLTELPHVAVRVLPLSAGVPEAALAGPFTMLDFTPGRRVTPDPPVVYRASLTGDLYLDRPGEITSYERLWLAIATHALNEDISVRLIEKINHQVHARPGEGDRWSVAAGQHPL
ncbi:helix-turn-helix domain-containing protein [Micromonospora yangpuensis]|uniref:Helix-turn-helix domain-containing protein n=1 Tax=Micromonospora yangpuensis TaxID=683228 RepID=A0A1C6UPP5_9ACTN|nr:helix-turn-helix transcriptional regulator [Micromonospora yangpuensis]GGM08436.1 transcriptional regulator [Micromonospora yangpuensis]SCL55893.1 Helix-turn-helix domain-containing protein [Micromonospora yangpuensis]